MLGEPVVNCPSLLIFYHIGLSNLILQVNKVTLLLYSFSRVKCLPIKTAVLSRDYILTGVTEPGAAWREDIS